MQPDLTGAYRSQRTRLASLVIAAVSRIWAQQHGSSDQAAVVDQILGVVHAGQAQTVALVDAYMALKLGVQPQGLDASRYTIDSLRSTPAVEVYRQPWGALAGQLEQGASFQDALQSADARLAKLATTDLQLAQTHSARDWMTSEPRVTAWERVTGANPCALCELASEQTYHTEDLMPIHEHCSCGVSPLDGEQSPVSAFDSSVRVVESDIGPRLLADDWAA